MPAPRAKPPPFEVACDPAGVGRPCQVQSSACPGGSAYIWLRKWARPLSSIRRVRISQPVSVTSRVCSNWAERFPSLVTAVQPSGHVSSCQPPETSHTRLGFTQSAHTHTHTSGLTRTHWIPVSWKVLFNILTTCFGGCCTFLTSLNPQEVYLVLILLFMFIFVLTSKGD